MSNNISHYNDNKTIVEYIKCDWWEHVKDNLTYFDEKMLSMVCRPMHNLYVNRDVIKTHKNICEEAAKYGFIDIISWAIGCGVDGHHKYGIWNEYVCKVAIKHDNLNVIAYANENDLSWKQCVISTSIVHNNQRVFRYAVEKGVPCKWNDWDMRSDRNSTLMLDINDIDFLKYAITLGFEVDKALACKRAVINNNIELLEFYHDMGCEYDIYSLMLAACMFNRYDVLTYLYSPESILDSEMIKHAIIKNNLPMLQFLNAKGCSWHEDAWFYAVRFSNLDCFKYIYEYGYSQNGHICATAANYNRLDILTYAHENGCSWDSDTCTIAAREGHLECLKYAHENGCSWNSDTCAYAALNGHIECLMYAYENGCSLDERACHYAKYGCNEDCIEYTNKNGGPRREIHSPGEGEMLQ